MQVKISKLVNDPIAFHLHKNRVFFKKIENKEIPPLTTRQILDKVNEEMKLIEKRSKRAMIWINTR